MKFGKLLELQAKFENVSDELTRHSQALNKKQNKVKGFTTSYTEEQLQEKVKKLKTELEEIKNTDISF